MSKEQWPTWLCSYRFDGTEYSLEIPARSKAEAEGRMRAIGMNGNVDGELVMRVDGRVPTWAIGLLCTVRNVLNSRITAYMAWGMVVGILIGGALGWWK